MLPPSVIDDWIKPETKAEAILRYAQKDVIIEKAS